jgi:hypothetical protein
MVTATGWVKSSSRASVREHDGVVVHVHHPALRRDGLGDLVGVACGRDAGADVEKLPDPRLPGEVADNPAQEGPVGPGREAHFRGDLEHGIDGGPVGRIVVLAAQQVVVDPGLVGHAGVERRPAGRFRTRHGCLVPRHPSTFLSI